MDFSLSPEQEQIRATFHAFAEKHIRPRAAELDEKPEFPRDIFVRAGELGFFGMRYAPPLGSGADITSYVLAVEELAWGSLAVAAACTMQSLMGTYFVQRHAAREVSERLLVPAMRGEKIGTICMTEPDSGSDLFSMKTSARRDGDTWLITGSKTWITSAPVADFFTVLARTGDKQLGVFLVERGAPGLAVGRSIEKMGVRASLTSEVFFESTPATCVLGDPALGTRYLQEILAEIRVMTGALSLGIARAAYEDARAYAAERKQFGKTIDSFQAIQAHLADMATELEAARRLVHWAAWRSDRGLPNAMQASMAKLFASETAAKNCDRAARVLASYGFSSESPVQRYLRDVRFVLIGGGTSEILRVNIARDL